MQRRRKLAFYGDAGYLGLIVCFQQYWLYQPTILSVSIVFSGALAGAIWILSVSLVSMRERQQQPPHSQGGHAPVSTRLPRLWRRV